MSFLKNDKGTTLIEVIAAVVLLTVSLLPLMEGLTGANRAVIHSGRRSEAIYLVQQELENCKRNLQKKSISIPSYSKENAGFVPMQETNNVFSKMVVKQAINPKLTQVEVTVKWGARPNEQVKLLTQVAGD